MPMMIYKGRRIRMTQRMVDLVDYALHKRRPGAWIDIGTDARDRAAAERLKAEGLADVAGHSNQYRVTP